VRSDDMTLNIGTVIITKRKEKAWIGEQHIDLPYIKKVLSKSILIDHKYSAIENEWPYIQAIHRLQDFVG